MMGGGIVSIIILRRWICVCRRFVRNCIMGLSVLTFAEPGASVISSFPVNFRFAGMYHFLGGSSLSFAWRANVEWVWQGEISEGKAMPRCFCTTFDLWLVEMDGSLAGGSFFSFGWRVNVKGVVPDGLLDGTSVVIFFGSMLVSASFWTTESKTSG
jgi:hypothetical protein